MMAKAKKAGGKKKAAKKEETEVVSIPPKEPEVSKKTDDEKDHEFVAQVLKEYGGESNVPINHSYWGVMNRIRGRRTK